MAYASHQQNPLHPDNKIAYTEGQRIELLLEGDRTKQPLHGKIVGISSTHIIDYWIVQLDEKIPGHPFSCITVQHTFIRPEGDNRPFLCEGVARVL